MNATSAFSRCAQILAVALVITGSNAFGQTIMTTAPAQSPISFSIGGISGSQNIVFDGFNTSLGTLQSVTIQLTSVVVTGSATLTANTTGQEVFSANLTGNYTLTDHLGDNITASVASADGGDHVVANGSTYYVLADPNNGYVGTSAPSGAANISSTPQNGSPLVITSNLSFYEGGAGAVTLSMTGHNTLNSSTSGAFTTTVSGTGTGTVTVLYTYVAAVPEPSKTAAFMIGFALCVLVGRHYFRGRGIRLA